VVRVGVVFILLYYYYSIILYYYILILLYIIHYTYIILLYIISYTLLLIYLPSSSDIFFPSPYSSSTIPFQLSHSFYTCRYLYTFTYIPSSSLPQILSPRMFYRRRNGCVGLMRLLVLVEVCGSEYIIRFEVLTPHILSEACLEWCSFICVVFRSDCKVLYCISSKSEEDWCLSWWCVWYYIIIILYLIHIISYTTIIIILYIIFLTHLFFFPSFHLLFFPTHSFYTCRYLYMFTYIPSSVLLPFFHISSLSK